MLKRRSGLLISDRFARSNAYNPEWITENPMGAHPLWLAEWLTERVELQPDMRVLDLGCGKAKSSIFLAREFDVEVWAVDLWTGADENLLRIEAAGVSDRVIPIHADARQLPFAGEFFDVIVGFDSFNFFGTDDLYLNYLAHFLREEGTLAFVSAGLMKDFEQDVPDHLGRLWAGGDYWTLHTADWWRRHVGKTGLFEVTLAETIPDGWRLWSEWAAATDAEAWYRETVEADEGRYLGYVGLAARRVPGRPLAEHAWPATLSSWKSEYVPHPLLRSEEKARGRLSSIVSRFRPGR
jgi:cyclopropane fatty-acyl-phospholipid synthase-like methyltransferase